MVAGGQIQNLSGLFSTNEIFEVPDFQRNYSWETKQVAELYDDIHKTHQQQDTHFLGSVILLRNTADLGSPLEVVDGQQRLTTIFLLIAVIRDLADGLPIKTVPGGPMGQPVNPVAEAQNLLLTSGEHANYRFLAHPNISGMVQNSVFAYPGPARPRLPKQHFKFSLPLRKAHKQLHELVSGSLQSYVDDEGKVRFLSRMLDTIKFKLKILNVSSDTTSEAYEIFMTLNSRGMPLGPSDLVKSEIFKNLTRDLKGKELAARNAQLASDWQMIASNLEEGDLDQFLRHFLVSNYPGALTSKKVFEKIDNQINRGGMDAAAASQKLLDDLLQASKLYSYLLANDDPEITGEEDSLHLLQELADSYRIFCLAVIDPRLNLSPPNRVDLIRLAEVLVLRWVLVGANAQELEDLMQTLSLGLRAGDTYETCRAHLQTKIPNDEKVTRAFEDTVESANLVRVVLYRINRRWDQNALIKLNNQSIHVEHIAPDRSTPHWLSVLFPNDEDIDRDVEYDAATELWGNKTLLDAKINQDVKQKPFDQKRVGSIETLPNGKTKEVKGYMDSNVRITQDLGTNFTYWDRTLISRRSAWIADCFLKIWAVHPDFDSIKPFSEWKN